MSRKNIGKFSWSYELVRKLTVLYYRLYYRRLQLKFRNKIPANRPVIFALNHQNALMDALSVVYTFPGQCVFMARADIFRKKWVARLLYFLKILPAYRIRDGFHSVDQNKEVFKEVISVFENNRTVALYPEGSHLGEKRLRQLKKGAARLALLAEEANGFSHEVFIVPVGLDYSNYYNAGSDLLIVIGDPISALPYREQYIQNPVTAVNNLTNELAGAMTKNIINIDSEVHYKTIHDAMEIYYSVELQRQQLKPTLWNNFIVKKELSEKFTRNINNNENQLVALKESLHHYHENLKKLKIRDQQISNPSRNSACLLLKFCISLILMPIHLFGMILNYLPYRLPVYLTRKIKDPHFIGSVRFGIGLILFFVWYPILIIISLLIFKHVLLSLGLLLLLPLTGLFTFYHYKYIRKLQAEIRWAWINIRKRKLSEDLKERRKTIIHEIEEFL
jgi:1-acyl-sn-glycerol-3-phosphate acyltransferase